MTRAQLFAVLTASVAVAFAAPVYAAPVDGALPVNGFETMATHDASATLDPLGDMSVDAASIARVWSGESNRASPANFSQPSPGIADFQALLRDSDGRAIGN